MISHYFFFFNQKTAYESRISDWSSDLCPSDLTRRRIADVSQTLGRPGDSDRASPLLTHAPRRAEFTHRRKPHSHPPLAVSSIRKSLAERRAGKECASTCSSRGLHYHHNKKQTKLTTH